MQVALVHFHLNRGGVTQVIANQLRALSATQPAGERIRVLLLFGGREEGWPTAVEQLPGLDVVRHVVPGLEYDASPVARPRELAADLMSALRAAGLQASDTVIHVHNHTLGKNASLPGAVEHLAGSGFRFLLQIHDFAEDFRPGNYRHLVAALAADRPELLPRRLYRHGPAVHFAVLNQRDYALLANAGMPADRLHILPNPVAAFGPLPDRQMARERLSGRWGVRHDQRYVLYPVRGIRRKNLGELALWAAATPDPDRVRYAVTLPPLNPLEQSRYAFWRELAGTCGLPMLFDVGAHGGLTFGENLAAADCAINTSVAEGFGMVFLEPWLAGLPLVGRDLPEITADFKASGIELGTLAPTLDIPLDWIGLERFERELAGSYEPVLKAYGRPPLAPADMAHRMAELTRDGLLDFAHCTSRLQAMLIHEVAVSPARRARLWELNPPLRNLLACERDRERGRIAGNARAVRRNYGLAGAGRRLREVYQRVFSSLPHELEALESSTTILDAFLSLTRFHPLRID